MNNYFIKFLYSVVLWGSISFVNQIILVLGSDNSFDLSKTLAFSLLFGLIVSIIISLIYIIRIRKMDLKIDPDRILKTNNQYLVKTQMEFAETQNRLEVLFSKKFTKLKSDKIQINILSFMSWSKVTIKSLGKEGDKHTFEINIKPVILTNVFDFAEGYLLYKKISKTINCV